MSREIKFRTWDKKLKVMLAPICNGLVIHLNGEINSFDSDGEIVGTENTRQIDLMQFTGLRDSKRTEEYPEGQEIYEGDILRYTWNDEDKIDVVEFSPPMFTYRNSIRWNLSEDEVIGNIYENPELLEVEQ